MISKSINISLLATFLYHASSFTFHPIISIRSTSSSSATLNLMAWTPNSSSQQSLSEDLLSISPLDEYNAALLNEVRPLEYINPTVDWGTVWDLVVVGAGAGGLVSSRQAARRGAKSAMISMELAGGDCLNAGCVPSKALLRCAKMVREARKAALKNNEFGVSFTKKDDGREVDVQVNVDFSKVMERMRMLRSNIAPVDGHARGNSIGSAVFQGKGMFTSPYTVEVVEDGKKLGDANNPVLRFRKAVIATGGRPAIPDVKGLADAPYTTNLNLFNLQSLPERMVILGAGIVALEMAQAFAAFGSKVTVFARSRLLSGDEDARNIIRQTLEQDGVTFLEEVKVMEVKTLRPRGKDREQLPLMNLSITHKKSSTPISMECECLLVAIGRTANVQNIGLENANVNYDPTQGVLINDYAQSISNPNIYAVGDCVANVPRLTHMSGEMAKVAVQNSLFGGEWKMTSLVVPAVMYTEPEYATVKQVITLDANGHIVPTPKQSSIDEQLDVYQTELRSNDRAILDSSDTNGLVKISCVKGTGTIVCCTIISSRAGEMINEVSLAIKNGISIQGLGRNIHAYPTLGEGVMGCGLQFIGAKWEKL
ncbi:hypothetical protein ACHAWO_002029 [Cyclotella atomus]|uniref:Mercuric reductase n=1 Tax=Cyclotella atomus TaxID=382360 RepID=A0ABD3PUT5_9STRA